jgi:hypothetical protein
MHTFLICFLIFAPIYGGLLAVIYTASLRVYRAVKGWVS